MPNRALPICCSPGEGLPSLGNVLRGEPGVALLLDAGRERLLKLPTARALGSHTPGGYSEGVGERCAIFAVKFNPITMGGNYHETTAGAEAAA